jgi:hypothetical protein
MPGIFALSIAMTAYTQDYESGVNEVVIRGFPLGAGESLDAGFFAPYDAQLSAMVDSLKADPLAEIVVRGSRDAVRFRTDHDAKNAGLSLGRADVVEKYLVQRLDADSNRIFIETIKEDGQGESYRYISVRLIHRFQSLMARIDSLEQQLASLRDHPVALHQVPPPAPEPKDLVIEMTAGLSASPFGPIPVATGAFVYREWLYIQGLLGHTWWDSRSNFAGARLYTWHRVAGGMIIAYPHFTGPVGLAAGWLRHEDISQSFYRYVRMTEGPIFGARVSPYKRIQLGLYYHPLKRVYGTDRAKIHSDQFLLSVTYQLIGGGR